MSAVMIKLVDYSDSEEEGESAVQAGREADGKKEGVTQQKVIEILKRNTSGDNILARIMKSKAYKNPGIDTRIIKYLNIDQFGSNYAKERLDLDLCKSDYKSLAKEQLKAHKRKQETKLVGSAKKPYVRPPKRED